MRKASLLLVEDDLSLSEIVKDALLKRNFNVHVCRGQIAAIAYAYNHKPDAYIVDVMLMDGDGFSLIKELRRIHSDAPVIFLTALTSPADVVKGFELGANDYMKKPFSIEELIARIENMLRKKELKPMEDNNVDKIVRLGQYHFNTIKQTLVLNDRIQKLSHRECEILRLLYINRNEVLDRKSILIKYWGNDNSFNARSMDVFIVKLRAYLKADPEIEIINIRGIGYKLII